jgi:hypothetical protein
MSFRECSYLYKNIKMIRIVSVKKSDGMEWAVHCVPIELSYYQSMEALNYNEL